MYNIIQVILGDKQEGAKRTINNSCFTGDFPIAEEYCLP